MNIYCVYFTVYSGQLMPPFYIGSTHLSKIIEDNYHGTPTSKEWKKIWSKELKENSHLFHTEIISLHETRKEAYDAEEVYQREENVVTNTLYINESIANGNFSMNGKRHDKETRKKMSESNKGKPKSEEHRKNIKLNHVGFTGCAHKDETCLKIGSALKGRKKPPFTIQHRQKIAAAQLGKKRGPRTAEEKKNQSIGSRGHKKKTTVCPHCGKIGGRGNMLRYHFDNCKFKDNNNS